MQKQKSFIESAEFFLSKNKLKAAKKLKKIILQKEKDRNIQKKISFWNRLKVLRFKKKFESRQEKISRIYNDELSQSYEQQRELKHEIEILRDDVNQKTEDIAKLKGILENTQDDLDKQIRKNEKMDEQLEVRQTFIDKKDEQIEELKEELEKTRNNFYCKICATLRNQRFVRLNCQHIMCEACYNAQEDAEILIQRVERNNDGSVKKLKKTNIVVGKISQQLIGEQTVKMSLCPFCRTVSPHDSVQFFIVM